MSLFYADASALVKLVRVERETASLRRFIADADLVSCDLVLTEVPRAVYRVATIDPQLNVGILLDQTSQLLDAIALLPVDRSVLLAAGAFSEPYLRALDAIHIAAAVEVSPVNAFISYDERQNAAARLAGLRTVSPT